MHNELSTTGETGTIDTEEVVDASPEAEEAQLKIEAAINETAEELGHILQMVEEAQAEETQPEEEEEAVAAMEKMAA